MPKCEARCLARILASFRLRCYAKWSFAGKRYLGKCVGGTRSFLRRDVSRRCLLIHPEGNAGHVLFLLSYYFSPLSLRRISALADMPRQVGAVFLRCSVFLTALRKRRYVVRHGRAFVCGACTVPSHATDGRNVFRTFLRGSGSYRFERMRFHEKKVNPALAGRGSYEEEKGVPFMILTVCLSTQPSDRHRLSFCCVLARAYGVKLVSHHL